MYHSIFGLSGDPFRMSPCAGACYPYHTFSKARSYVLYSLQQGEGILVISGSPGLGKTTLVRNCIGEAQQEGVSFFEVSGSHLAAKDFLYIVAHRFGVDCEGLSEGRILTRLENRLVRLQAAGRRGVLLVDEAQDLDIASMNQVKALSNLEYQGSPLMQIFLVGQNSLLPYLRHPELEALFQRVTAACQLEPMDRDEVGKYVLHRLKSFGWKGEPGIERSVIDVVFRHSGGNPRRINLIFSRLLLKCMINDIRKITTSEANMVLDELSGEGLEEDAPRD